MAELRPELPAPPPRIAMLPVHRGYPVPWFAAWVDGADPPAELPRGQGTPDFRLLRAGAVAKAHNDRRCWICGMPRGVWGAFMGGPMCAVTRTSAEPPSHLECAEWAIRACPFLVRPHAKRRENALPEDVDMPGIGIMRNPGAGFIWVTRDYIPFRDGKGGVLFQMGEPRHVDWYAEGRPATRDEVDASIESGLPALRDIAMLQAGGVEALKAQLDAVERFLPARVARIPYVGEGADGCRRSAQIDRDEADTLAADDPRRALVLASAERWDREARR